jgi:hypothetical protein
MPVHAAFREVSWRQLCSKEISKAWAGMTCRIDRLVTDDDSVIFSISGRVTAEDLDVLRDALARESRPVAAVDLKNVLLIDRNTVKFILVAEANGVELRNCPPFVREWIAREKAQGKSEPRDDDESL